MTAEAAGDYRDTAWWRTHFSGALFLDLWQAIVPPEQAARDADFLQAECRLAAGARVLDVPCGDGRVALELAARGFRLVGVDISPELLAQARRRSDERRIAVEWHEGDMRRLPWHSEFDAAYCWGDSFGYFDDAGNQEFLTAVHESLKPDGRWAMEMTMVAEVLFPRFRAEEAGAVGDIRVNVKRAFDPRLGRLSVDYALERDGREDRRSASYRIYSCRDIDQMLARAGFIVQQIVGGAGEPFRIGSDRLRIVARRGAS